MVNEKQSLRRELDEATLSLGHTINQIEGRVEKTYSNTKERVEEVIDHVNSTAQALSPTYQIKRAPAVAVLGAVAVGFLLAPRRRRSPAVKEVGPVRSSGPGWFHRLVKSWKPELEVAKAWALTAATQWAADEFKKRKPELQQRIDDIEDKLVEKFRNGFKTERNISQSA